MLKKILTSALVAGLVFVVTAFLSEKTILLNDIERGLSDTFFYIREPAPNAVNPYISRQVKLAAIDNAALSIAKWPFDRDEHVRYLNRVGQFSPGAVFFDIAFIDQSKPPRTFKDTFGGDPALYSKLEQGYAGMDLRLADAFRRIPNMYIDLFLTGALEHSEDRVRLTQERMKKISQPAGIGATPLFFSLEPLVDAYQNVATPSSVNVFPDPDNKLRQHMLVHTVSNLDGSVHNYFSIVMNLLKQYYHVPIENIAIGGPRENVKLQFASVPRLNPDTRQPVEEEVEIAKLLPKLAPYERSAFFNPNLVRAIVADFRLNLPDDPEKIPLMPVRLLKKGDQFVLLEGQEILEAALALKSTKVRAVLCDEKTVTVKFSGTLPNAFPINYGSQQEQRVRNEDGTIGEFTAIPKVSYLDIYNLPVLPAIPAEGRPASPAEQEQLLSWYQNSKMPFRLRDLYKKAAKKYGEANGETVLKYASEDNRQLGRHHFYKMFIGQGLATGSLADIAARYEAWGKELGLNPTPEEVLGEKTLTEMLIEDWNARFQEYYGKFVFTGAYSLGMAEDVHKTPLKDMFGINSIIWAFSTVVTDNQLSSIPTATILILLFLVVLLLSIAYGYFDIRIGGIVFVLSFTGTLVVSFMLFMQSNLQMETIPFLVANLIAFISIVVIKVLTEEKDKRFLKATFSSYLAPELIDEMYNSKQMPKLGGDAGIRTAFFTDIQGFSSFSEKLTSEQLVELLNEYLNSMTNVLLEEKGTLDKYIGDAIIGIFGAPARLPDHSYRALRVAVRMQLNLAKLREKWQSEEAPEGVNRNSKGLPESEWIPGKKWPMLVFDMRVRVGINTGDMTTGNMGSTMRMNYTMMGDTVNLAARLEAGAKQFGVYNLASESSINHVFTNDKGEEVRTGDLVHYRFIDRITVVGKTEPVEIFEVIGIKGEFDLTPEQTELFRLFDQGVKHYQAMEWDKALEIFHKTAPIELYPMNKYTPSKMYIERCENFKANPPVPPGEVWDGVFRMTQKH